MPKHPSPPLTDGEYHVMLAAISETARGRNFLAEYARRACAVDTHHLFAAQSSTDVSGVRSAAYSAEHMDAAAPEQAHDPWAAIRSMSEEERLRIFS